MPAGGRKNGRNGGDPFRPGVQSRHDASRGLRTEPKGYEGEGTQQPSGEAAWKGECQARRRQGDGNTTQTQQGLNSYATHTTRADTRGHTLKGSPATHTLGPDASHGGTSSEGLRNTPRSAQTQLQHLYATSAPEPPGGRRRAHELCMPHKFVLFLFSHEFAASSRRSTGADASQPSGMLGKTAGVAALHRSRAKCAQTSNRAFVCLSGSAASNPAGVYDLLSNLAQHAAVAASNGEGTELAARGCLAGVLCTWWCLCQRSEISSQEWPRRPSSPLGLLLLTPSPARTVAASWICCGAASRSTAVAGRP